MNSLTYYLEPALYRVMVWYNSSQREGLFWPDRFELSQALDCARALAREGKYVKIQRETDGVFVWNSVDND